MNSIGYLSNYIIILYKNSATTFKYLSHFIGPDIFTTFAHKSDTYMLFVFSNSTESLICENDAGPPLYNLVKQKSSLRNLINIHKL